MTPGKAVRSATTAARKRATKIGPPKNATVYVAAAPSDKRAALAKLRETIRAAAPEATESVSYGIVGYKYRGQRLIHFGYWKEHVALYGTFEQFATELARYDQSGKGTIRFPLGKPLPYRLVTKMVRARRTEIEGRERVR